MERRGGGGGGVFVMKNIKRKKMGWVMVIDGVYMAWILDTTKLDQK